MKHAIILSVIAMFLGSAQAAQSPLAEKFYPEAYELTPTKGITQIIKAETAKENSPLAKLISTLESENCDESCISIAPKQFTMVYTGKSGVQYFGATYLVPVWASYKGSGLIEEVLGHLVISFSTDMDKGTTVTIQKFIPLSLN